MRVLEGAGAVIGSPVGFAQGLSYAFRGMRFVYLEHPRLVRYWAVPILITAVAVFAVFYGSASYYQDIGTWVLSWFPESWNVAEGWTGAVVRAVRGTIVFLLALVLTLIGLVIVVALSSIVAAPFNDALSEAVEQILTGQPAPPFSFKRMLGDVVRTVRIETLKVVVYGAIIGPLFVVSLFVPGIGQVVSLLAFALTAIYLGVDYVDWPAARRDWSVSDRLVFARRKLPAVAGFGTGVWVLLFIPLVNLLFMPAAVAGGTILFIDLQPRAERDTPV